MPIVITRVDADSEQYTYGIYKTPTQYATLAEAINNSATIKWLLPNVVLTPIPKPLAMPLSATVTATETNVSQLTEEIKKINIYDYIINPT